MLIKDNTFCNFCVHVVTQFCCGLVRYSNYTSLESACSKAYKMHSYNAEETLNLHIIILHWQDLT